MKDNKKRKCLVQYAPERMRITALRKNDILPIEIKEIAHQDINALPRDSSIVRIRSRCAVTSRPRGVVYRWRLSRIVWRQLADYNKLSGVQRAMWWSCNYKNEINKCLVNFIWRFRLMFVANERYLKTETHSSCLNWSSNGHHLQRII